MTSRLMLNLHREAFAISQGATTGAQLTTAQAMNPLASSVVAPWSWSGQYEERQVEERLGTRNAGTESDGSHVKTACESIELTSLNKGALPVSSTAPILCLSKCP